MAHFIWDTIAEILVGLPGAFIIWARRGFKERYVDILTKKGNRAALIGLIFWILFASTMVFIRR